MDPPAKDPELKFQNFIETMKHPQAKDLVLKINRFMKDFKERKARDPASDSEAVQSFLLRMQKDIEKHSLWSDSTEAQRDEAMEGLEKYLMNKIYDNTFNVSEEDKRRDEVLATRMSALQFMRPEHLDIPPQNLDENSLQLAVKELSKLNIYKAPRDKLICILNCCRVINTLLVPKVNPSGAGADDFTPLLIFCVIRARPVALQSNLAFIERYRMRSKLVSEAQYYYIALCSAAMFIETLTAKSLNVDMDEFLANFLQHGALTDEEMIALSGPPQPLPAPPKPSEKSAGSAPKAAPGAAQKTPPTNQQMPQAGPSNPHNPPQPMPNGPSRQAAAAIQTDPWRPRSKPAAELELDGTRLLLDAEIAGQLYTKYRFLYMNADDLTVRDVSALLAEYKDLVLKYEMLGRAVDAQAAAAAAAAAVAAPQAALVPPYPPTYPAPTENPVFMNPVHALQQQQAAYSRQQQHEAQSAASQPGPYSMGAPAAPYPPAAAEQLAAGTAPGPGGPEAVQAVQAVQTAALLEAAAAYASAPSTVAAAAQAGGGQPAAMSAYESAMQALSNMGASLLGYIETPAAAATTALPAALTPPDASAAQAASEHLTSDLTPTLEGVSGILTAHSPADLNVLPPERTAAPPGTSAALEELGGLPPLPDTPTMQDVEALQGVPDFAPLDQLQSHHAVPPPSEAPASVQELLMDNPLAHLAAPGSHTDPSHISGLQDNQAWDSRSPATSNSAAAAVPEDPGTVPGAEDLAAGPASREFVELPDADEFAAAVADGATSVLASAAVDGPGAELNGAGDDATGAGSSMPPVESAQQAATDGPTDGPSGTAHVVAPSEAAAEQPPSDGTVGQDDTSVAPTDGSKAGAREQAMDVTIGTSITPTVHRTSSSHGASHSIDLDEDGTLLLRPPPLEAVLTPSSSGRGLKQDSGVSSPVTGLDIAHLDQLQTDGPAEAPQAGSMEAFPGTSSSQHPEDALGAAPEPVRSADTGAGPAGEPSGLDLGGLHPDERPVVIAPDTVLPSQSSLEEAIADSSAALIAEASTAPSPQNDMVASGGPSAAQPQQADGGTSGLASTVVTGQDGRTTAPGADGTVTAPDSDDTDEGPVMPFEETPDHPGSDDAPSGLAALVLAGHAGLVTPDTLDVPAAAEKMDQLLQGELAPGEEQALEAAIERRASNPLEPVLDAILSSGPPSSDGHA